VSLLPFDQRLHWWDLDPAVHAFEPARTAEIVERVLASAAQPSHLVAELGRSLVAEHGVWVTHHISNHLVFARGPTPGAPRGTRHPDAPARVTAALGHWRGFLERLAEQFDGLRFDTQGLPIEAATEMAASRLLPIVVDHTYAEDAWYQLFATVLCWYLESAGADFTRIHDAVERTISGRFESWVAPTPEVAHETFAVIGAELARMEPPAPQLDSLDVWKEIRATANRDVGVTSAFDRALAPVLADGHERYIERVERARDPERAERMAAALLLCRDSALRGMDLTLDQLAEWQAIVLGRRVELRTTVAFGKRGRERYGISASLRSDFERVLAEAAGEHRQAALAVKAAALYVDVCYFHPFEDGNARAARLALDHLLTRTGHALHAAEPVFVVSRSVTNAGALHEFSTVMRRLIGTRLTA
jgi:prophage maintenance system killer protein